MAESINNKNDNIEMTGTDGANQGSGNDDENNN